MEILEAYDLVGTLRGAAELANCDHHTGAHYVEEREAGGGEWKPKGRPYPRTGVHTGTVMRGASGWLRKVTPMLAPTSSRPVSFGWARGGSEVSHPWLYVRSLARIAPVSCMSFPAVGVPLNVQRKWGVQVYVSPVAVNSINRFSPLALV